MSNPVITELTDLMREGGIPHYIYAVLAKAATEINRLDEERRVAEAGERSADQEVERLQKLVSEQDISGDIVRNIGKLLMGLNVELMLPGMKIDHCVEIVASEYRKLRDLLDDIKATLILEKDEEILKELDRMIDKDRAPRDNRNPNTYTELVDHYQLARDRLDELYGILRVEGTHASAVIVAKGARESADILQRITTILNCTKTDAVKRVGELRDLASNPEGQASKTLLRIQQILGMKGSSADALVKLIVDLQSRSDLTRILDAVYRSDEDSGMPYIKLYENGEGAVYHGNAIIAFEFENMSDLWAKYEREYE